MVRNEIPSTFIFRFLFRGMVRNEILSFYYLLRNGLERNSEHFPFRGTDGILTELVKISACFVFRGFFSLEKYTVATLVGLNS
jgi:hypothetical protein